MKSFTSLACTFLLLVFVSCTSTKEVNFKTDLDNPQIEFAINQIKQAAESDLQLKKGTTIQFTLTPDKFRAEAYRISKKNNKTIEITASDISGLMYGGLELADQISIQSEISETIKTPYIKSRGIKINIPLDARTPSYDDSGDAAQRNIAEMWEWGFWEEFLDQMAINRFNTLTLWNPHPFPSMIKMENYPDIALDDVCVTTLKPVGIENEWAEPQLVSKNVIENLEVVKTMTIDEKIAFWKKVMQYAKDRGIDVYFFTWNVCPNGVANPVNAFYRTYKQAIWDETPGKYGVTNQMNNPKNIPYYREAVKEFLLTYPLVKGIGVTAGEHMIDVGGEYTREQWIWETYGKGILEAKKVQPNRHVNFIHRVWNTDMNKIMDYWKDYPDSFEVSFKYAKARLYSSPYLSFADSHIETMRNYNLKSWWNLRNDDIFVYRWSDPDYVRAFIKHFQKEHTSGFYMGSDGYVWGKEFVSKDPELSGQLEINKHWAKFMLWGQLSFDPSIENDFFIKKLEARYPETNAKLLFSSWQAASKIIPKVNCFHWRDWDHMWSVEACIDARIGFRTVKEFINNPTMRGSNILNPSEFAKNKTNEKRTNQITPFQISDSLSAFATEAINGVEKLRLENNSTELNILLDDILAMAYLGQYYSAKISSATELALLMETKDETHRETAVLNLEKAVEFWKQYMDISEKNYHPQMLARTKELDWGMRYEDVKKDVEIAKEMSIN